MTAAVVLEVGAQVEVSVAALLLSDACALVVADFLLEEVGLAFHGDHVHPVEGVFGFVLLLVAEREEESVCDELDVLAHELRDRRLRLSSCR